MGYPIDDHVVMRPSPWLRSRSSVGLVRLPEDGHHIDGEHHPQVALAQGCHTRDPPSTPEWRDQCLCGRTQQGCEPEATAVGSSWHLNITSWSAGAELSRNRFASTWSCPPSRESKPEPGCAVHGKQARASAPLAKRFGERSARGRTGSHLLSNLRREHMIKPNTAAGPMPGYTEVRLLRACT